MISQIIYTADDNTHSVEGGARASTSRSQPDAHIAFAVASA
jgi:hypothetical protein